MELYRISLQSHGDSEAKFILFRPLLGVTFIGNRQMAELTTAFLVQDASAEIDNKSTSVQAFLESIGFLDDDPEPPYLPTNLSFSPTHAILLLTNRCQMRCIYCYASGGELVPEDLSITSAKAAIDIVYDNAISQNKDSFNISFHGGGEPTVAWAVLTESTQYARSKSLKAQINLTSNGVWSPTQLKWIIKNIDSISLSMDGHPDVQDHNRPLASGALSSPILKRTLQKLDENNKNYAIRMTAIAPWDDLPKSVAYLLENTGCKGIQVEPAFNSTRGLHTLPNERQADQFIEAFMEAYAISEQHQRTFRYSGARVSKPVRTFCTAPYNCLIINPRNEIVACYEITNNDHELAPISLYGHLINGQIDLVDGARAKLMTLLDQNREKCQECFCYWTCAGDCYTRTLSVQEDMSYKKQSARCRINQTLTKELLLRKIAEGDGVAHLFTRTGGKHHA